MTYKSNWWNQKNVKKSLSFSISAYLFCRPTFIIYTSPFIHEKYIKTKSVKKPFYLPNKKANFNFFFFLLIGNWSSSKRKYAQFSFSIKFEWDS